MYQVIPNRNLLAALLAAGLLASGLLFYQFITGEAVQWWGVPRLLSATLIVIDVALLGLALAWRRLWRQFPLLNCWIFPDLNGEWVGEVTSIHENEMGEVPTKSRQAKLRIRQGWKSFSVELTTDESKSISRNLKLDANRSSKLFALAYQYSNDPIYQVRNRSQRHDGTAELAIDLGTDPNRIAGKYYTDRNTSGQMDFVRN